MNRFRFKKWKWDNPCGFSRSLGGLLSILMCLSQFFSVPARAQDTQAWRYAGVPYTDWHYDPFTHPAPATPAAWPSAGVAGYYRIEPDNPNSSDKVLGEEPVDANGRRYGYPARPRLTLPLISKNGNSFPPGTVFWMKGGTYNTIYGAGEVFNLSCVSTPEKPFWIYGDPTDRPVFLNGRIILFNSAYGFVENIVWDKNSKGAGCIGFGSPFGEGATHHIAVRNIDIQNRNYVSNGAMMAIAARGDDVKDGDIHDIVFYRINFKANGYGISWDAGDPDMHGYKINGTFQDGSPEGVAISENRVYRIWVIENKVMPGESADPIDGKKKGIAGSFVQIGDQKLTQGNNDHIYVAGCHVEGIRQSCVGHKRSADCVVSSNVCANIVPSATAQGQAFNYKYDRQDNLWLVNNYVRNTDAFVIRAETTAGYGENKDTFDKRDTRVYIVGNIFKNCMREPWFAPDAGGIGGRKSKGICIQDFNGKVYVMNNIVDTSPYGIYYGTSGTRQSVGSEMHAYNNVFLNISPGLDTSTAADNGICVIKATDTRWFMENNFSEDGRNYFNYVQYRSAAEFNARPDAAGNLQGNPLFMDVNTNDYTPKAGSPLIGAGVKTTTTTPEPVDLYRLFINAFAGDPDFPGGPVGVWPRDFVGNSRFVGGKIDIGPYAFGSSSVDLGESETSQPPKAPQAPQPPKGLRRVSSVNR